MDLSLDRIAAAVDVIDPIFLNTPQFVDEGLSAELGREALVKVETLNPIGSFKGRGTWLVAQELDPATTWVCATGGNFGQGLAYAARAQGAGVHIFAAAGTPSAKLGRMRALGARVEVVGPHEDAETLAAEFARASEERLQVRDGVAPAIAEGAGTIGIELATAAPIDTAVVQVGDGALITGVARWLKAQDPRTRVVGVCAAGAPAMARSFEAGALVQDPGKGTIATALAIREPVPESFARVRALIDEIVLVDDDDMRQATELVAEGLGLVVEPAGAAGVAAVLRHRAELPGERLAVLLTGAGTPDMLGRAAAGNQ